MSIGAIVKGISKLAGEELGARVTYESLPAQEPPYLPMVAVEWTHTAINGSNYATQSGKRLIANADVRVHQGSLLFLYSASSNAVFEIGKSYEQGEKLLNVFKSDIRLEDATGTKLADKVTITQVQPIETQWGQTIYFGIQADWEAYELL